MRQLLVFLLFSMLLVAGTGCGDASSDSTDTDGDKKPTDTASDSAAEQETETIPDRPDYTPPADSEDEPVDTESMTCFYAEECGSSIPFERIVCPYPLTPTMDGDLEDDAWQSASWEFMDHASGSNPADDDEDAAVEFACVADTDYIYIAYRIHDDVVFSGEVSSCDVWADDSVEFYIDACYERAAAYDGDDAQVSIGAENVDITNQEDIVLGGCNGPFQGPNTGSISYSVLMDGGWMGELAIPLKPEGGWSLEPTDGQIIGFNAHYNDDDDGGDRDHKLIWSLNDRYDDLSWQNPQKFGALQFCNIGGGDSPDGGVTDAGPADTGADDTGVADTGANDAGATDAKDAGTGK